MTKEPDPVQAGAAKPGDTVSTMRRSATVDLTLTIAFFLACYTSIPILDPILRNGRGLAMAFATAAYQFSFEGIAPLVIMGVRREHFSDYGLTKQNAVVSLALALLLTAINDLGMSWHAGALMWIPMRRQPVVRMSLALGFAQCLIGLALTVLTWGFFEGFFGVFFSRKFNQAFGHGGTGWLAPGVVAFALFNGLIHMTVGQGVEGFVSSFVSGYAIAVIPAVTKNAWGSALVQTLTDAVGKL